MIKSLVFLNYKGKDLGIRFSVYKDYKGLYYYDIGMEEFNSNDIVKLKKASDGVDVLVPYGDCLVTNAELNRLIFVGNIGRDNLGELSFYKGYLLAYADAKNGVNVDKYNSMCNSYNLKQAKLNYNCESYLIRLEMEYEKLSINELRAMRVKLETYFVNKGTTDIDVEYVKNESALKVIDKVIDIKCNKDKVYNLKVAINNKINNIIKLDTYTGSVFESKLQGEYNLSNLNSLNDEIDMYLKGYNTNLSNAKNELKSKLVKLREFNTNNSIDVANRLYDKALNERSISVIREFIGVANKTITEERGVGIISKQIEDYLPLDEKRIKENDEYLKNIAKIREEIRGQRIDRLENIDDIIPMLDNISVEGIKYNINYVSGFKPEIAKKFYDMLNRKSDFSKIDAIARKVEIEVIDCNYRVKLQKEAGVGVNSAVIKAAGRDTIIVSKVKNTIYKRVNTLKELKAQYCNDKKMVELCDKGLYTLVKYNFYITKIVDSGCSCYYADKVKRLHSLLNEEYTALNSKCNYRKKQLDKK